LEGGKLQVTSLKVKQLRVYLQLGRRWRDRGASLKVKHLEEGLLVNPEVNSSCHVKDLEELNPENKLTEEEKLVEVLELVQPI
jgi:hypothetical protein